VDRTPDSGWLASLVVVAYSEQRYDLGEALARLCGQAHRMESAAAMVPAVPVVVGPEVYQPEHSHVQEHDPVTGEELYNCGIPNHRHTYKATNWCAHSCEIGIAGPDDPFRTDSEHCRACNEIAPPAPVNVCQDCGVGIRWSINHQEWSHINGEGNAVTSRQPPHVGRPAAAINEEAPMPPAEEAPTLVTPSARCIATVGDPGRQTECHGVLYWAADALAEPGWLHFDPQVSGHQPVANRPDPA
jgi:hypothetical protein